MRTLEWMLKVQVLLQLFNKSKLSNGTKTFLEPKFFFIDKFKKLGFSTPLSFAKVIKNLSQGHFRKVSELIMQIEKILFLNFWEKNESNEKFSKENE